MYGYVPVRANMFELIFTSFQIRVSWYASDLAETIDSSEIGSSEPKESLHLHFYRLIILIIKSYVQQDHAKRPLVL